MVFDTTDSKLSSFINEAQADDLTAIASLVFSRVASLETNEQERFVEQLQRDPQAKHVLERMQSYSQ
jgi:hypothetical protein